MRFTVRTPASSANLGPGFDALGLALGLWNEATIDLSGEPGSVKLCGTEAALLDGRVNLTLTAMKRLAHETGLVLPSCSLVVRTDVPVARGLGSSAAALVAGLVAANHLLNTSLAVSELYSLAWQMEGHGDNVGAALYGGAVLAVPGVANPVQLLTHGRLDLCAVVFIPQVTGLTRAAGALGACLSGAGPAVLALTEPDRTEAVAEAYRASAAAMGVAGEVRQLGVAPVGAEIVEENGRVTRPADQRE